MYLIAYTYHILGSWGLGECEPVARMWDQTSDQVNIFKCDTLQDTVP